MQKTLMGKSRPTICHQCESQDFMQVSLPSDLQSFHYTEDVLLVGKPKALVSWALTLMSSRLHQQG